MPTQYTSNSYLTLASADLDGDGILDLVAGEFYAAGMDVFLGLKDGGLSSPTHYDAADGLGIAVADLNGDGFPDVVATASPGVSVFLNKGNGKLSPAVTYEPSLGFRGVAVGDVDGDGVPDLVLAGDMSELLLGTGSGSFGAPKALAAPGGEFGGIVVVDLNKDGLADIAVNDTLSGTLTVLLSECDGGLAVTSYPTSNGGGVAVLDDRRDGAPDLVVGSWAANSPTVSIFRNRGDGHFEDGGAYLMPTYTGPDVMTGDLNGDCLPDLVASGFDNCANQVGAVVVLYADGNGGFTPPATLQTAGATPAGLALLGPITNPRGLAVADSCSGGISTFGVPVKP